MTLIYLEVWNCI